MLRSARATLVGLTLLISAPVSAQMTPLTDVQRAIVDAIPDGTGGEVDRSYVVTNEWGHRVWFSHLEGRGGAYVGVGADQSYTLAAAAGSDMMFMVDYDPVIPLVHRMYSVLVPASATPAELIARFEPAAEGENAALIAQTLGDAPDAASVTRLYRRFRHRLLRYLNNASRYAHGQTWLSHAPWYAHVRALFRAGRVVARTGDLTAADSVHAIGDAIRELGMVVRVTYFSNAEQFFPNRPQFIRNVHNLPTDERSIVLRTVHAPPLEAVPFGRWHYVVQPHADMTARLDTGRYLYRSSIVDDLVRARRMRSREVEGLSVIDARIPMRE
ncbi:MAG: hypothetical protein AB8I08_27085 [Sandaracinaceae bacterium]